MLKHSFMLHIQFYIFMIIFLFRKRLDELIPEIDTKLSKHRENLASLQKNLKDASMEVAQKKCHTNVMR